MQIWLLIWPLAHISICNIHIYTPIIQPCDMFIALFGIRSQAVKQPVARNISIGITTDSVRFGLVWLFWIVGVFGNLFRNHMYEICVYACIQVNSVHVCNKCCPCSWVSSRSFDLNVSYLKSNKK